MNDLEAFAHYCLTLSRLIAEQLTGCICTAHLLMGLFRVFRWIGQVRLVVARQGAWLAATLGFLEQRRKGKVKAVTGLTLRARKTRLRVQPRNIGWSFCQGT